MNFDMRSAMELSRLSSRGVFGKALSDIEPEMPELMVVVADVASSARVEEIARRMPEKFVTAVRRLMPGQVSFAFPATSARPSAVVATSRPSGMSSAVGPRSTLP